MSSKEKSFILHLFFPASVLLLILWACNQVTTTESYLNMSKLYDSLKVFDSVQVFVMDKDGNVLDTAFHGAVDSKDDLTSLSVAHYHGENAIISVLGFNKDKVVYESQRFYNGSKGKTDSIVPIILPTASITLTATDTQITEGDSVLLPTFTVLPPELSDKTVLWYSSDSHFVSLSSSHYRGVKPGTAMLSARLKSNPAKQAGFSVQVLAKAKGKAPDSLILSPDTLRVAAKGAPGQFTLNIRPTSASASVVWASLDSTLAQVSQNGSVQGVKEGKVRIRVASKEDAKISDTAWVLVSAEVKVDSVRFVLDSMNLFIGGVSENLFVNVFPPTANQEVAIQVKHPLIATLDQGKLKGVKEGSTFVVAASKQDQTKVDTLYVTVTEPQIIDSLITKPDTLILYTGGRDSALKASVYPTKASQEVKWQSSNTDLARVESSGKVIPIKPGKVYVVADSRADSTRKDSSIVIVKKDTPRLNVGPDTILAVGSTLAFSPKVSQDYGSVVSFKWDLDGDGAWDDSAASVDSLKSPLSHRYDKEEEVLTRFYVKDTEGNDTTMTRKVKAVIGPVIRILTPADNSATNQTVIDVTWSVDGVLQTAFTKQDLVSGPNTITRKAKDGSGKEFSASITVVLDTLPPGKPVLHGPTPVNTQLPTWTWTTGGGGKGTYRYRLDDQDMSGATLLKDTTFTPAKKLTEEVHTLFVQEQDAAGNWSQLGRLSILIDLTPPASPKVGVKQVSPSNEPKPTWSWAGGGGDGIGVFRYRLDGSDLGRGAVVGVALSYAPAESLSSGQHTMYVQERDSAGNWSAAGSASIVLDLLAPNAPKISVSPDSLSNNPKPTWTWVTGGNAGAGLFRYRLDTSDLGPMPISAVASFSPAKNLAEGSHVLYVQEKDSVGNWSQVGSSFVWMDVTPPNAPKISVSDSSPSNNSRPIWSWGSGGNGGAKIYRYKLDSSDFSSNAPGGATTSYTPTIALSDGKHTLYVQERDFAGNWSESGVSTLRIDSTRPNAPTVSTNPTSPGTDPKPAWNWVSGGNGGAGVYRYKLDTADVSRSPTIGLVTTFTPADNLPPGDHVLYVQERDSAGNWSLTGMAKMHLTWSRLTFGDVHNFYGLKFTDHATGYIIEDNHTILKTNDSGGTWTPVFSDSTLSILSIDFLDKDTGYAAGYRGAIIKTNDAGRSWKTLSSGTDKDLISIAVGDAKTIYVAGVDGLILKTTDGGANWNSGVSVSSGLLLSVYFLDASNGWAVGYGGKIFRTTAGGAPWTYSSIGSTMNSIYFANPSVGYASGQNGTIMKSTDGGASWSPQTSHSSESLTSIFFIDVDLGYAVGTKGTILKTVNGGSDWTPQVSGTNHDFFSVKFTSKDLGHISGYGGLILKTISGGQ